MDAGNYILQISSYLLLSGHHLVVVHRLGRRKIGVDALARWTCCRLRLISIGREIRFDKSHGILLRVGTWEFLSVCGTGSWTCWHFGGALLLFRFYFLFTRYRRFPAVTM